MTEFLVVATEWNSARGGISSFSRSLCTTIAAFGRTVTCFVPRYTQAEADDAAASGVTLLAADAPPGANDNEALFCGLPSPIDCKIVIGHGRITGPAATQLRRKSNQQARYVHFLHMDPKAIEWEKEPVDGEHPEEKLKERVAIEVKLARDADLVYAVGPQLRRSFEAYLRPHDVDVYEFRPGLIDCRVATKAAASKDCLLFGRVEDYGLKGVGVAAKAMQRLVRKQPSEFSIARLMILGARPDEARKLYERVRKVAPSLTPVVEPYTANRDEVSEAILRAALVLMPSRTEGFGLAALEAISHGVPVLVSAQSGLAEALTADVPTLADDHIVSLHLPRAAETFAERIGGKLLNPELAFTRVASLRSAMEPNFSWKKSVKELLDRLDGPKGGDSPPAPSQPPHPPPEGKSEPHVVGTTPAVVEAPHVREQASGSTLPRQSSEAPTDLIVKQLADASRPLLAWPQTLTTKRWLERPQLAGLKQDLLADEARHFWLLGAAGSGKSAFLARLAAELRGENVAVLAIKADQLESEVADAATLAHALRLSAPVADLVLSIARVRRVVLVLDQLDALSDIADLQTARLGALLGLLRTLRRSDNVSVVASCRAFDFARDIRFRELDYDEVELEPLTGEQVELALGEGGVAPEQISAELRAIAKNPHWLNVFLRLTKSGSTTQFVSRNGLLEELWTMGTRAAGPGSEALLADVADAMAADEVLWVSLVPFTERIELVDRLESGGILRREETRVRIGFAHQTFFEFAHARAFVSKKSLSTAVRASGYSLAIRPVVWAALGYMREARPKTYATEIASLLADSAMRMHLRVLILQFVGQVEEPTSDEQRLLASALDDGKTHAIAIKAIAGRIGWFGALKQKIRRLMNERPGSASVLLHSVVSNLQADVRALIQKHWLGNPAQHDRIGWILLGAKSWEPETTDLVGELLEGGGANNNVRSLLLGTAARLVPSQAPAFYAVELRKLLADRLTSIQHEARPGPEASDADKMRWEMHREPRETLGRVLHEAANLPSFQGLATKAPQEFLQAVWPWFVEVVGRAIEDAPANSSGFRHLYMYEADPWERSYPVFGSLIGEALRRLAPLSGDAWQEFVAANASSDNDTIHQCILCGFEAGLPAQASNCAEYFLGDPRRLGVGDNAGSDSIRLLAAVAPFLDEALHERLRAAIELAQLVDETAPTAQARRRRRQLNAEHRKRLSQALASVDGSDLDDDEDFPQVRQGFRVVESHVSVEQMARMQDDHILGLFSELIDETEFTHPRKFMSGGSVQASRVLGEVVRKSPEAKARYVALAKRFSPLTNQRPAASILEGLLETGYGLACGGELILELDRLGFRSEEFRWTAAYAIEKAASETQAIEPALIELLESWLSDAHKVEPLRDEGDEAHDVIWGWGMGGALPGGNFPTLFALTKLLLVRPEPDLHTWVAILSRHLRRRESPRVWGSMAPRLDNLRHAGPEGAKVLAELFEKFPDVRDSVAGARLLASATWWCDAGQVESWVRAVGRSDWKRASRAFGELVGLLATRPSTPAWVEAEVDTLLSSSATESARLGLLTSAAHLWDSSETREKATEVLVRACAVADSQAERDILLKAFDFSGEAILDAPALKFLRTLEQRPAILQGHSTTFAERMSTFLVHEPELIASLALSYVKQRLGEDLMLGSDMFSAGPVLANVAVTLHRSPAPLRDMGLELLEQLLVGEAYGVSDVLTEVDRGLH